MELKWLIAVLREVARGSVAALLAAGLIIALVLMVACAEVAEEAGVAQRKLCESSLSSPYKDRVCQRWGYPMDKP